ncbi:hypothetical protein CC2G_006369 [Coprinopsis cinerea AmutBmut pab1-1]|nr:hypothetical protein CC2G_006369 [Coprinopsis cinerea AmutBmut pab1-1]
MYRCVSSFNLVLAHIGSPNEPLSNVQNLDLAALFYNICDYIQTFELEVQYMWGGRWTPFKIAYFLGRYTGLIDYPLIFIYHHAKGLTPSECRILLYVASCSALTGSTVAEILMFLRVYVLSGCSKAVGWFLTIEFTVAGLIIFVSGVLSLKSVSFEPSPVPALVSCILQDSNKIYLSLVYFLVLFHQTTALILSFYFGLSNFRRSTSPLITILYRDGTLYFMALAAVSIGNLIVVLAGPIEHRQLFLVFQRCIHSTLSTRIILKMREMAARDLEVNSRLHVDGVSLTSAGLSQLQFSDRDEGQSPKFTRVQHEFIAEGPDVRSMVSVVSMGVGVGGRRRHSARGDREGSIPVNVRSRESLELGTLSERSEALK